MPFDGLFSLANQNMLYHFFDLVSPITTYFDTETVHMGKQKYVEPVYENIQKTTHIQYATIPPTSSTKKGALFLDLYEPVDDKTDKRPLIVYAFAGGFLWGARNMYPLPYYAKKWAERGFVVASIDYRLGAVPSNQGFGNALYKSVQDMSAALRFLVHFQKLYRLDTSHIFIGGSSAGALTALHYAFSSQKDLDNSIIDTLAYGKIHQFGNTYSQNKKVPVSGVFNLWGALLDVCHIKQADNIPALISFHGHADSVVPFDRGHPFSIPLLQKLDGSAVIHDRLTELNIENELHEITDFYIQHEPEVLFPKYRDVIISKTSQFMAQIILQNKKHT